MMGEAARGLVKQRLFLRRFVEFDEHADVGIADRSDA
jgi:hypothetical protein